MECGSLPCDPTVEDDECSEIGGDLEAMGNKTGDVGRMCITSLVVGTRRPTLSLLLILLTILPWACDYRTTYHVCVCTDTDLLQQTLSLSLGSVEVRILF